MFDIYGDSSNNALSGGALDTNIYGNAGNDTLSGHNSGGSRKHRLTGGEGADTFNINASSSVLGSNAVEILDYDSAEDSIIVNTLGTDINVDDFYTVHYGTGDSTSSFIHDEGNGEMVAAIFGDYYDLPPVGSR